MAAVCHAFMDAVRIHEVPEEVLTEGKMSTGRCYKPGVPVEAWY